MYLPVNSFQPVNFVSLQVAEGEVSATSVSSSFSPWYMALTSCDNGPVVEDAGWTSGELASNPDCCNLKNVNSRTRDKICKTKIST